MTLLNEEGRLNEFASRYERRKKPYKTDDLHELRNYWEKSDAHQQKLNKLQPDIVERINEQIRIEKEEKRNRNEEVKKEEANWLMDDDNENSYEDDGCYSILTKEEKDMIEKEGKKGEREAIANQIKLEQKDIRENIEASYS